MTRPPSHGRFAAPCLVVLMLLIGATAWAQDPAPAPTAEPAESPTDTNTPTDTNADAPSDLPADAHLRVELTPREITVGDVVTATLLLEWPAGAPDVTPRFPAWQDTWGDAEVLDVGTVRRERGPRGQTLFVQTVQLTAFRTGDVDLPRLRIAMPLGGSTPELSTPEDLRLTVGSVLPEGEEATNPQGAVAPRALPIGGRFWWTTGILATLCALTAVAVARRHPTAFGGLLTTPRLPPFDELRQRLSQVRPGAGSETVHTQVSLALRTYLGRAAGVQAVERTTSEIRRLLRDSTMPPELVQRTVSLLQRCDEAKFVPGVEVPEDTARLRVTETEAIARVIHESQQHEDESDQETDDDTAARRGAIHGQGAAP